MQFKIAAFIIVFLGVVLPRLAARASMSSASYSIPIDSFSLGGLYGTSTSYSVYDTISNPDASPVTSTTYTVKGGFQGAEFGILTFSVSNNTIALGTLSTSAVASASTVATVSTNSDTGYTLSVASVSGSSLAAIGSGTVTAGTEGYGVAVSGADAQYANDKSVAAGLALSSISHPITSDQTTLTFKAAISSSSGSASGATSYSQSVVVSVSANI